MPHVPLTTQTAFKYQDEGPSRFVPVLDDLECRVRVKLAQCFLHPEGCQSHHRIWVPALLHNLGESTQDLWDNEGNKIIFYKKILHILE